ncbi:MAG TPA: TIGR03013 family XrtA/PEP-CTERM system glycosyltransferase [Vicinamibacterales bacterium]|nr:TIGR03013 family XrtA/PEP-CTERM system glycosyltransferase [Vicinamibacterales bacterium]
MRVFNRYVSRRHLTVFTGELLVIFGSMTLVAHRYLPGDELLSATWKGAVVTALCLLCLYYNDLYDLTVVRTSREVVIRLLQAIGTALILIALLYVALPGLAVADGAFLPAAAIFLTGVLVWRLAFNRLARLQPFGERVLIVGTDPTAQTVARLILAQQDFPYEVVGFIGDDPKKVGTRLVNPGIVGTPDDIERLVTTRGIDRIFVGLADRRGRLPVRELLQAKLQGVRVEDVGTVYERLSGRLLVEDLRPSWLIFSDGFRVSRLTRQAKRAFDLLLALTALVLSLPLMVITALAVRLESGVPVLYRQDRVGENGRVFTLYKFRSMRPDAEQGTPVWASAGDDRVTRIGRFIRRTRLDELPQLWNVLRGDMSFVGPRPERPYFVGQLAAQFPFYDQRHAVKPGITGWAQVKYRYGASLEDALEKLRYDLYYVKHMSLPFDLTILFDTVKVVLFAKGAR